MSQRRAAAVVTVMAACVALTACGARLSPQQRSVALRAQAGGAAAGAAAAPGAGGTGATDGTGTTTDPAAAPVDGSAPVDGAAAPVAGAPVAGAAAPAAKGGAAPVGGAPVGGSSGTRATGAGAPVRTTTSGPVAVKPGTPTKATAKGAAPAKAAAAPAAAPAAAAAPNCGAGARTNSDVGVTANDITIANASDISGAVPGLFLSARESVQAFVAYYNATGQTVCGRTLKYLPLDSRADQNGDRDAATQACGQAFAMVGSISAFDQGGSPVVQQCGIPDIRTSANTIERQSVPNVFGANSAKLNLISSSVPDYIVQKFPDAAKNAAYVYINVGVAQEQDKAVVKTYTKRGFVFKDQIPIDIGDVSYNQYAQQLKRDGIKFVQFIGAYQQSAKLAQAFKSQGYKPDFFLLDFTGYNPDYIAQAADAGEGTYIYNSATPFEEAANNPETLLYLQWLQRTNAQAAPSAFGEFAWSAARLFVTEATKAGTDLKRAKVLSALAGEHAWTGNGITSPQDVGGKNTGKCFFFQQLQGGKWARVSPASGYSCGDLIDANT